VQFGDAALNLDAASKFSWRRQVRRMVLDPGSAVVVHPNMNGLLPADVVPGFPLPFLFVSIHFPKCIPACVHRVGMTIPPQFPA